MLHLSWSSRFMISSYCGEVFEFAETAKTRQEEKQVRKRNSNRKILFKYLWLNVRMYKILLVIVSTYLKLNITHCITMLMTISMHVTIWTVSHAPHILLHLSCYSSHHDFLLQCFITRIALQRAYNLILVWPDSSSVCWMTAGITWSVLYVLEIFLAN